MVLIKVLGLVNGGSSEFDGQYLSEYDPSRKSYSPSGLAMMCHMRTTSNPDKAMQFEHIVSAIKLYQKNHGLRPDGHPNRPLTAFTVAFEPIHTPTGNMDAHI